MSQSLAVYIHWPFCRSKCPYCDFNSHVRERVDQEAWLAALLKEMEYFHSLTAVHTVVSVFFGGGTPSLMPAETVDSLIAAVHRLWKVTPGAEITLEANPTSVEAGKFRAFRAAGVNRVSLGVQALGAADLTFLGREHSESEALKAVELAASVFDRYSFDMIYARPNQTSAQWERELTTALAHAKGHMSLYQLTIEENTAFHHAYHARKSFTLPDEERAAEMYDLTQDIMESAGMPAYEVSNHAVPGQECRHNIAYWRGEDYVGIGPGAHGRIGINGERTATVTLKSPERWLEAVQRDGHGTENMQPLTPLECLEERLMMGLRLREGLPRVEVLNVSPESIHQLEKNGLLTPSATHLQPTARGRLLLNYVAAELLE